MDRAKALFTIVHEDLDRLEEIFIDEFQILMNRISILERQAREKSGRRHPMGSAEGKESERRTMLERSRGIKGDYQPGEAGSFKRSTG